MAGTPGNNGVLFPDSALKGEHFIGLCCRRKIPLLFLQNITGFMVGSRHEAGGIAWDGDRMVAAVSAASVPKVTVIVGGSRGAGSYGMCGRACNQRFLWMWPSARTAAMGGELAARVLATVRRASMEALGRIWPEEEAANGRPVLEQFERQSDQLYASARLRDDGIIDPRDTRRVVAMSLDVAANAPSAIRCFPFSGYDAGGSCDMTGRDAGPDFDAAGKHAQ